MEETKLIRWWWLTGGRGSHDYDQGAVYLARLVKTYNLIRSFLQHTVLIFSNRALPCVLSEVWLTLSLSSQTSRSPSWTDWRAVIWELRQRQSSSRALQLCPPHHWLSLSYHSNKTVFPGYVSPVKVSSWLVLRGSPYSACLRSSAPDQWTELWLTGHRAKLTFSMNHSVPIPGEQLRTIAPSQERDTSSWRTVGPLWRSLHILLQRSQPAGPAGHSTGSGTVSHVEETKHITIKKIFIWRKWFTFFSSFYRIPGLQR